MIWCIDNYTRNDRGQVAVIFALAALPLLALTSAAVDFSQITKERAKISSALDAAVLAAANNNAIKLSEKDSYAEAHFLANYEGDIQVSLTPSVTASRVRLAAEGELPLDFGNLVGIKNPTLNEASAATLAVENTICVLALSQEDDASISFDQDMEFLASGCAVHSNSESTKAILAENKVTLPTASSFCAVGGILGEVEPHSKGECSVVEDPYSDAPPAPIGVCKSEFLFERLGDWEAERNSSDNSTVNLKYHENVDVRLPNANPIPLDRLENDLDEDDFEDDYDDGSSDFETDLEDLHSLSGADLRNLLRYYDKLDTDNILKCRDFPIPRLCYTANNPYLDGKAEARDLAGAVFDMSFGQYFSNENGTPKIISEGIVELINGQLYSRNNVDNELVAVSSNLTGGDIYLTPGTYCGGLTVDGLRVRFSPGDYVFKDGPLTFLNKSQAHADRVTFGFSGAGATLNIESGSSLTIRSALKGPRKGLAFMHMVDSDVPGNRPPIVGMNRISSGGSLSMSGTAYFPNQTLMISGEDTHLGASSPAVGLIADKIKFRGDRGSRIVIAADHQKAGIPPIQPRVDDGVRLIE